MEIQLFLFSPSAAPKGGDPTIIAKLDGAFRNTLKDEIVLALLRQSGVSLPYTDTATNTKTAPASADQGTRSLKSWAIS